MKKLYTQALFLLLSLSIQAQVDWHEHFSHDRTAYRHLGQFIQDGKIVMLMGNWEWPMNTLETIEGRKKKNFEVVSQYNEYINVKTTQIDVNHKEILLARPWDYDIQGLGVYSVRMKEDALQLRSILDIEDDIYEIEDAYMPVDPTENKLCIIWPKELLTLDKDDNILANEELEVSLTFHETAHGLYKIQNGVLEPFDEGAIDPCQISTGDSERVLNDPFSKTTAIVSGIEMQRYDLETCSLIRTDVMLGVPRVINFIEGGFYYLVESAEDITVYYYDDATQSNHVWYGTIKDKTFDNFFISDFEIIENDVYFFGVLRRDEVSSLFSYVQRRNRIEPFEPKRKDLRFDSLEITGTPSGSDPWDSWTYEYRYKITNIGPDTIYDFTLMSNNMRAFSIPQHLVKENISTILPPGETYEGIGEFTFYQIAAIRLFLIGVDYGLDDDFSNNDIMADVKTLSTNDISQNTFLITPNPTSDFLYISEGQLNKIEKLIIRDIRGQGMEINVNGSDRVDVTELLPGKYWLEVISSSSREIHSFIKIN